MTTFMRSAALLGLFVVCIGCSDQAWPNLQGPSPIPQLTGPATTYRFSASLDYKVRSFTERSSFVLYESSGFYLWYESSNNPYHGIYERNDGQISFYFERSTRPVAVGNLKDDLLEVRFSELAQHSDFENAVYKRAE